MLLIQPTFLIAAVYPAYQRKGLCLYVIWRTTRL